MDRPLQQNTLKSKRNKTLVKYASWGAAVFLIMYFLRSLIVPSISRADIRLSTVQHGNIEASLSAGGTVIPKIEEVISSEITAQVAEVLARPGQAVKTGDTILKMDTKSVRVSLDSLEERIAMKENQILSKELQTRQTLNSTNSRIELLEVDLESRKTRFERMKLLSSSGATAKHDLLEAELDVKRTEIEIRQLKTSLTDLSESNKAEIEGIRLEKSILEKEKNEQLRLLESATVKAPRAGILTWLLEEEGTSISPGQPVARVADLSSFRIEATISDFYANQLHEGQDVVIHQSDSTLRGTVHTILPTINNGILTLLVELENPSSPVLRSNLRVDVELITGVINNTLTVGTGPFVNGSGIHDVFVIKDNVAVKTEVEIGLGNADYYQIVKGLSRGDQVIISNMNEYLHLSEISIN